MKKALLTTSALAGASLLLSGVAAQAAAPEMTFSGALSYVYVLQSNSNDHKLPGTGNRITANDQQSEFVWDAKGTTDGGLGYTANVQWRYMNGDDPSGAFDEAWVDINGSFGRIYMGGEDGVAGLVGEISATNIQAGAWGTDSANAWRSINLLGTSSGLMYWATPIGEQGDNNKIGYVSPSFGGFQIGVSFKPGANKFRQAGPTADNGTNINSTEVAARYDGSFGDVSFGLAGAYINGKNKAGGDDTGSYQIGGSVGVGPLTVAAAFLDNGTSNCAPAAAGCDAGSAWNVGAAYSAGPAYLSASYQDGSSDTDGNDQDDSGKIIHLGAQVGIADGLSAYANYYNADIKDDGGLTDATKNKADVLLLGTKVSF